MRRLFQCHLPTLRKLLELRRCRSRAQLYDLGIEAGDLARLLELRQPTDCGHRPTGYRLRDADLAPTLGLTLARWCYCKRRLLVPQLSDHQRRAGPSARSGQALTGNCAVGLLHAEPADESRRRRARCPLPSTAHCDRATAWATLCSQAGMSLQRRAALLNRAAGQRLFTGASLRRLYR